jgi:ABC-type Fe3+/spermidine/putrescine transport system ATPase subunit
VDGELVGYREANGKLYELHERDVARKRQEIGMVFQSFNLFPHMTALENVTLAPMRVLKRSRDEVDRRARELLDRVGLTDKCDQHPVALSGGQQQRVALARAFVFQPSVLLFDEPLSNLDAKLRADMRIELRDLQHRLGITSVYVTHDLEEALAMSDHIVVMRDGLVEQTGTPDEIYALPRSAFVADFVGSSNLIRGRNRPDLAADGLIALETPGGQVIYGSAYGRPAGDELTVSVRTVHLRLSPQRPAGERNVWPARLEKTVFQGDFTQVHVRWGGQPLIARCAALDPLPAGQEVFITVDPKRVVLLGA